MNKFKECRLQAGLSQRFVANTLKVASPSVSNWESGKTMPTPENLAALASLYGVSVDYLLGRDEEKSETMNRVKELCIRKGLAQKQLAAMIGVSQPTVSDWFNNKSDPSGDRLQKLSDVFGVSRPYILGYNDDGDGTGGLPFNPRTDYAKTHGAETQEIINIILDKMETMSEPEKGEFLRMVFVISEGLRRKKD